MQQIELELAGGGVLTVSLRASLDAMPTVKQRPLVLVVPATTMSAPGRATRWPCSLRRRVITPPC